MSSGGYTPTIKTANNSLPISSTIPILDLSVLASSVDQALLSESPVAGALVNGAVYKIVSVVNNTSVLDVNSHYPTNGTLVSLWGENNPLSNNQNFLARKTSDGYFTFKSLADTTKVLDVQNGATADGTQIRVYSSNNGLGQKWSVVGDVSGTVNVKSALASKKSLDVNGGSSANGTKIQIWASNAGNAQKFRFIKQ